MAPRACCARATARRAASARSPSAVASCTAEAYDRPSLTADPYTGMAPSEPRRGRAPGVATKDTLPLNHAPSKRPKAADRLSGRPARTGSRPRAAATRPGTSANSRSVRQAHATPGVRVDPEEGAGAAEVAERRRRVRGARPVRTLRVLELEAEAPVVRLLTAQAREDADEAGKATPSPRPESPARPGRRQQLAPKAAGRQRPPGPSDGRPRGSQPARPSGSRTAAWRYSAKGISARSARRSPTRSKPVFE